MPDLLDLVGDEQPEYPEFLDQVRLGPNPAHLLLFTSDVETVLRHYVQGPPVNGYVVCPGDGCPACHLRQRPTRTHLLPVLHVGRRAVQVCESPTTAALALCSRVCSRICAVRARATSFSPSPATQQPSA